MSFRPPLHAARDYGITLTTEPATEVVTATELRTHIRVPEAVLGDTQATAFILQARKFIEDTCDIAMIDQTWTMYLDHWPLPREEWWDGWRQLAITEMYLPDRGAVVLPKSPLSSVTSVSTFDRDDSETSITVATVFYVDTSRTPGRLVLRSSQTWPTFTRKVNGIKIVFAAGYGTSATDVPQGMRNAVMTLAGYLYTHQGECEMTGAFRKSGASEMLSPWTRPRL